MDLANAHLPSVEPLPRRESRQFDAGACRRWSIRLQWIAAAILGSILVGCGVGHDAPACSALVIVVDTLRADHLGAYGYPRPTSPAIDRLGGESTLYRRAYSTSSWTLPAMAALLTSRYSSDLGIQGMESNLPARAELLSEILRREGFATGAVVSATLLARERGFAQGFEHFDEANARGHFHVTSPGVTQTALALLDRFAGRRFFLLVHFFDPHFAYQEHAGFRFGDATGYQGPVVESQRIVDLFALNAARRLGPADYQRLRDLYDSEIAFTDHHVGRLLEGVRQRGLLDETMVILTADHGEEFGDHGGLSHTYRLYEELIRVPLMVRIPGRRPGVVEAPVSLIDVAPTVLAGLGVAMPGTLAFEGQTLPTAELGEAQRRTIFAETTQRISDLRAAVDFPLKIILDRRSSTETYFDLVGDPGERLAMTRAERPEFEPLARQLHAWLVAHRGDSGESIELDSEERARLHALGYL